MIELKKLIDKLCPNGVEYKILNDFAQIYDGTHQTPKYTSSGVKFVSVENINDLYKSNKFISQDDYNKYKVKPQFGDVLMTRIGTIGVCNVIDRDEDLAYYVSLALIRPNSNLVDSKYLKYYIESTYGKRELRKRTLTNAVPIKVNMGEIGKIKVALPPIEIQRIIIQLLDNYTKVSRELLSKISEELTSRQKQFKYYFYKLMNNSKYPKVKIGDIGQVKMCKRILKSQTNPNNGIPFYKIGTFGKKPDSFIEENVFNEYKEKYSYPQKGDILISCSGTIGRTVIFDGEPAYFQDSNIVWLEHNGEKITNEFLMYCYMTNPWKVSAGGTIARLYNDNILKAEIILPPIEEQQKIVSILNEFYKICNDLQKSLSVEMDKTQKQYEFYRDKLLSFKEVEENV